MIEIALFGKLLLTVGSALSIVLLLVALTATTYLAMILATALRASGAMGAARAVGIGAALAAFGAALAWLSVGPPGSGGELVPTLAVAVAGAAAIGATSSFAWLGGARAVASLGSARAQHLAQIEGDQREQKQLAAAREQSFRGGDDVRAEVVRAEAAVYRLRAALMRLERASDEIGAKLAALDEDARAGDLGRELRRAEGDLAAKLDLGGKILGAAEAAAFRLACNEPLRRLLRRRPQRAARDLGALDDATAIAHLDAAAAEIAAFLDAAREARGRLDALEPRQPPALVADVLSAGDDPLALARRDVSAVEAAYQAVHARLDVVRVRLATRADMDEVASAAGEVSEGARASGLDARELQELVGEVTRAESAILMATPGDLDTRALEGALARSTAALDQRGDASLDDLLRALREIG